MERPSPPAVGEPNDGPGASLQIGTGAGGTKGLNRALVVLGLAVSALFTYFAVRDVDWDVFWSSLQSSNYWWLVPSIAVMAVGVVMRTVRWQLVFEPATRPPFRPALSALLIGYLFNNILPARAGELIRVIVLHQRVGTSRVEGLGTAVADRVYDVFALLVLLFVAQPFLPEVTWLRRAAILALVLALLLLGFVLVLVVFGDRPLRVVLRPLARLPKVSVGRTERAAENLVQGLAAFRDARLVPPAFTMTIASWLVIAASYWLVMFTFDLDLPYSAGLLVVVAANLAMAIPSSPGALGVFEAAVVTALSAYGVDKSEALSYAVVLHAVNFLPFVVAGGVALYGHLAWLRQGRPVAAGRPT